jgi:predicted 2-oxoglutarate/Fe(II)-dependent dioxygenase YbiX
MIEPIEIKNFLNENVCNEYITIGSNFDLKNATTDYINSNFVDKEVLDFNKRKIAYIPETNFVNLSNLILDKINSLSIYKGFKYDKIIDFSFNKYSEGDYLNYHFDGAELKNGATLTIVLELSDDYEGGEFCYMYNDEEHRFEKGMGSLYIFDSNMLHKVNPVVRGNRYSINCWPKYSIKKTIY